MTTELEEQFYKTFEIEPKYIEGENLMEYSYGKLEYPEITDRILLKLICKAYCLMFSIQGSSIELLKENILKEFIYWQEDVDKSEIQQLFKGGMTSKYEKIKAILEARDCKPKRIKCRKCKIQEVCQSLQIKQWLEQESEEE